MFNTLTYIPEEKITVDEALVLMAMLNKNYEYYTKLGNKERNIVVQLSRHKFNIFIMNRYM